MTGSSFRAPKPKKALHQLPTPHSSTSKHHNVIPHPSRPPPALRGQLRNPQPRSLKGNTRIIQAQSISIDRSQMYRPTASSTTSLASRVSCINGTVADLSPRAGYNMSVMALRMKGDVFARVHSYRSKGDWV